ncbi:MAG TPA: acetyl-CoA carboxylase, carboxyltransferase subunit beta [Bacteroidota bacterium]|nr:acetyl-CoA carboxylase, carboxyltransferase subunit beta [Bacteroidota bacterium]
MAWFRRSKESISSESQKKDTPEGLWRKCESCGEIVHKKVLEQNLWVCAKCNFHFRIGSREYFSLLLDEGSFRELDRKMTSKDPLNFTDTKRYKDRVKDTIRKSGLNDAVRSGTGKIKKRDVVIACMDFAFIGGSMGSVVGEKISRAADKALKSRSPLIVISSSGGARMMEAAYSLMQMAKTSAKLARLSDAHIPYISLMTDPTTGGVTASYAMLGDIHIAEPGALIGFAGPRVIKQTIGKDLPPGFQKAEFVQEKGFIDLVVNRKDLRETISKLLEMIAA